MISPAEPPRIYIRNLRNNERVSAQFNPNEMDESVAPQFSRMQVQGLSHEVHHFTHTGPYEISMKLRFRAYSPEELEALQRARRQMMSWAYPRAVQSQRVGGGPPKLLVVWPGMLSLVCYMTGLKINHASFNSEAQSVLMEASVTFEECPDRLMTMDHITSDPKLRLGKRFKRERDSR